MDYDFLADPEADSLFARAGIKREDYPDALGIAEDIETETIVVWGDAVEYRFPA